MTSVTRDVPLRGTARTAAISMPIWLAAFSVSTTSFSGDPGSATSLAGGADAATLSCGCVQPASTRPLRLRHPRLSAEVTILAVVPDFRTDIACPFWDLRRNLRLRRRVGSPYEP